MPLIHIPIINNQIISTVLISNGISDKNGDLIFFPLKALWDTGAQNSAIKSNLALSLSLVYNRNGAVNTHNGNGTAKVFNGIININGVSNSKYFSLTSIYDILTSTHPIDILIGMDIISQGKLLVVGTQMLFKY